MDMLLDMFQLFVAHDSHPSPARSTNALQDLSTEQAIKSGWDYPTYPIVPMYIDSYADVTQWIFNLSDNIHLNIGIDNINFIKFSSPLTSLLFHGYAFTVR